MQIEIKNGVRVENEVTAVKCSRNLDFGQNKATLDMYDLINPNDTKSLICPSNQLDLNLEKSTFDPNQSYFEFRLQKCQPSIITSCASKSEIDDFISDISIENWVV